MVHRNSILFPLATLALIGGVNAQEESRTRQRGLGATNVEYVSDEPLTFETPEQEEALVDRYSLLAIEPEDEGEFDNEVMDDMHLTLAIIGANAQEEREAAQSEESVSDEPLTFEVSPAEREDFEKYYEIMDGEDEGEEYEGEWLPMEEGEEVVGDFDSTYSLASEDGLDEEKKVYAPISRRLRRITNPVEAVEELAEEMDEERSLAEKESLREENDSIPIFEPTQDENEEFDLTPYAEPDFQQELSLEGEGDGRNLQQSCSNGRRRIRVEIMTDSQGWENSWNMKKPNNVMIMKGPPQGSRYGNNRSYVGSMCVPPGNYKFTINDKFRDGMCGQNSGRGFYKVYLDGTLKAQSPSNCALKWGQRIHSITVPRSSSSGSTNNRPNPSPPNNSSPSNTAIATSGRGGCHNVKITFKVDKFGHETTATLSRSGQTMMQSVKEVGAYQTKVLQKCVPPGTYDFKMLDSDGLCCSHGRGYYKMEVDGQPVVHGAFFVGSKTHRVKIGTNWQSSLNNREKEWLTAHNKRRRERNGGKGYVALRWSTTLARNARSYAETLGNNCNALPHAKGISEGENMARNKGSGSYANMPPADNVLNRWVEKELNWAYPACAHMTQALWRATHYVGCGESMRQLGGGQICRTQVCRYTRPGNCNVRNTDWRSEAWKDSTQCGQACPTEGCFV